MQFSLEMKTKVIICLQLLLNKFVFINGDEEIKDNILNVNKQLKFKATTFCEELEKLHLNITVNDILFLCKKEMLVVVKLENSDDKDPDNTFLLMKQFDIFGLSPVMTIYNDTYSHSFVFDSKVNFTLLGWTLVLNRRSITGFNSVPPISLLPYDVIIEFPNHLYRTETILRDYFAEPFLKWTICCPISFDYVRKYVTFLQPLELPCVGSNLFTLTVVYSHFQGIVLGLSHNNKILYYNLASLNNKQICGIALDDCTNLYLLDALITTRHLIFATTKGIFVSNDLLDISSTTSEEMSFKLIFSLPEITETVTGIKRIELKSNIGCDFHSVTHAHLSETVFFSILRKRSIFMSNKPYTKWESISLRQDRHETLVDLSFDGHKRLLILLETSVKNISKITVMRYPSLVRIHSYIFPKSFKSSAVFIHSMSRHIIAVGNEVWISTDNGVFFRKIHQLKSDDMVNSISNHMNPSGEFVFVSNMGKLLYGKIGIPRMISSELPKSPNDSFLQYNVYRIFINDLVIEIQEFQKFKSDFILNNFHIQISKLLNEIEIIAPDLFSIQNMNAKQAILYQYDSGSNNAVFDTHHIGKLLTHKLGGKAIIKDVITRQDPNWKFLNGVILNLLEPFSFESENTVLLEIKSNSTDTLLLRFPSNNNANDTGLTSWTEQDVGKTVVFPGFPSILLINFINSEEIEGISTVSADVSAWDNWKSNWYLYSFISDNESLLELAEDKCRHVMDVFKDSKDVAKRDNFIIDLKDKLQLEVEVGSLDRDYASIREIQVYALLNNPDTFHISGKRNEKSKKVKFSFNISAIGRYDGPSSFIISMLGVSIKCNPSVHFIIYSCCPESKNFKLTYTLVPNITTYNYQQLPINYRPPSQYGVAVPTSSNIYNADPTVPRWQDKTLMSQATGEFKQCKNKTIKEHCGCTELMELSSLALYSDCKRRVREIRHLTYVLLNFTFLKQQNQLDWASFISLREVNQRKDYSVLLPDEMEVIPDMQNKTGFSNDARLSLKGSGLYHFRIILHSDTSKCNLTDEFQVFAIPVSLPYPFYYMWNCLVVITTGVVLLATYIWYTIAHPSTNRFQRQHHVKSTSGQSATLFAKV